MRLNFKNWRESASIILAARCVFSNPANFNYKLLCIKRSATQKFMPETYVFPGGVMSQSDRSNKWLKLYEKFGFTLKSFKEIEPEESNLFWAESQENELPKYIAARICSIRETFEECGLLLCRSPKVKETSSAWTSFVGGEEILKWQDKVHDNADEFFNMCDEFDIYPDIWGLKLWANWITPPSISTRFNTIFFMACLNQIPPVHLDQKEVIDIAWTTPDKYISLTTEDKIMLPPPQFYEISRLRSLPKIDALAKFAHDRSGERCEAFLPFRVRTKEAQYGIFPGDAEYPEEIDINNPEITFKQNLSCDVQNRLMLKKGYGYKLLIKNYVPKYNHLLPKGN